MSSNVSAQEQLTMNRRFTAQCHRLVTVNPNISIMRTRLAERCSHVAFVFRFLTRRGNWVVQVLCQTVTDGSYNILVIKLSLDIE